MAEVTSSKPSSQRKWHYSKPLHKLRKGFSSHLSKELRKQLGRRSLELRRGDTVKVMRGGPKYLGKAGKVTGFKALKMQVLIEGIMRKKVSGAEIHVPFRASNLLITAIDEKDPRRLKNRKAKPQQAKANAGGELGAEKGNVKNGEK